MLCVYVLVYLKTKMEETDKVGTFTAETLQIKGTAHSLYWMQGRLEIRTCHLENGNHASLNMAINTYEKCQQCFSFVRFHWYKPDKPPYRHICP